MRTHAIEISRIAAGIILAVLIIWAARKWVPAFRGKAPAKLPPADAAPPAPAAMPEEEDYAW